MPWPNSAFWLADGADLRLEIVLQQGDRHITVGGTFGDRGLKTVNQGIDTHCWNHLWRQRVLDFQPRDGHIIVGAACGDKDLETFNQGINILLLETFYQGIDASLLGDHLWGTESCWLSTRGWAHHRWNHLLGTGSWKLSTMV